MKNFLLVYPTQVTEAPMTLAMLGAVLREEGFRVHTLVNTFKRPLEVEDFVNEAFRVNADFVGISMITFDVLFVYEIADALREHGFPVIMGGAHPTDCPAEAALHADIVVRGEGEETLREIVRGEHLSDILGITTVELNTPPRPRLNVKTLPRPDLSIFDWELFHDENDFYKGTHRIYTSRGCPGRCSFCDWQVFKQHFEEYDVKEIVREIQRRKEFFGTTSFSIADDCFTVNRDRVFEFCELIAEIDVVWRANSRANLVDLEMLQAMKASGCHSIAFGLESGDPETLKRIGKEVTLEENLLAPRLAHEAGLECYGCLMIGFPWETASHVRNQIHFIHAVWDYVSLFQVSGSLMPFPGAHIYKRYAPKFGFERFWLDPECQKCGIQVYQNARNPYKVSTLYQRLLFDDTYIQEEVFFPYSNSFKSAVREMVLEIGRHNLEFMFRGRPLKQKLMLGLAKASMFAYDVLPGWEKAIFGTLFHGRSAIESLRDKRRGIAKRYTNPN